MDTIAAPARPQWIFFSRNCGGHGPQSPTCCLTMFSSSPPAKKRANDRRLHGSTKGLQMLFLCTFKCNPHFFPSLWYTWSICWWSRCRARAIWSVSQCISQEWISMLKCGNNKPYLNSAFLEAKADRNWLIETPCWRSHQGTRNSSLFFLRCRACHCTICRLLARVRPPPAFTNSKQWHERLWGSLLVCLLGFSMQNCFWTRSWRAWLLIQNHWSICVFWKCTYLKEGTSDQLPMKVARKDQHSSTTHFHTCPLWTWLDQTLHSCISWRCWSWGCSDHGNAMLIFS